MRLRVGLSLPFFVAISLALSACANHPSTPSETYAESDPYLSSLRETILMQYPDADIPDVRVVRTVSGRADWVETMIGCLAAAGFTATERSDGGIDYTFPPPGQEEAMAIANYVCSAQYPMDVVETELSEADIRLIYDYYVNDLIPCLRGEGYETADTPSFGTFQDGYASDPWSPYDTVISSTDAEWQEINARCPQLPQSLLE